MWCNLTPGHTGSTVISGLQVHWLSQRKISVESTIPVSLGVNKTITVRSIYYCRNKNGIKTLMHCKTQLCTRLLMKSRKMWRMLKIEATGQWLSTPFPVYWILLLFSQVNELSFYVKIAPLPYCAVQNRVNQLTGIARKITRRMSHAGLPQYV